MNDKLGFQHPANTLITNFQPCRYTEVDVNTGARAEFFRLETIKIASSKNPFWALNKGTICCRWVTDPPNYVLLSPMVGDVNNITAPLAIQSHPDDLTISQVNFEEYVCFVYEFLQDPERYFFHAKTYDKIEELIVTKWMSNEED